MQAADALPVQQCDQIFGKIFEVFQYLAKNQTYFGKKYAFGPFAWLQKVKIENISLPSGHTAAQETTTHDKYGRYAFSSILLSVTRQLD